MDDVIVEIIVRRGSSVVVQMAGPAQGPIYWSPPDGLAIAMPNAGLNLDGFAYTAKTTSVRKPKPTLRVSCIPLNASDPVPEPVSGVQRVAVSPTSVNCDLAAGGAVYIPTERAYSTIVEPEG